MLNYKLDQPNQKVFAYPKYSNPKSLQQTIESLSKSKGIVELNEIKLLNNDLNKILGGDKFLLHLGECAEEFSRANEVNWEKFKLAMGEFAELCGTEEVIKLGRIAGQFAKSRSNQHEIQNNHLITSYMGDLINGKDIEDREPNCNRMLEGFSIAASTKKFVYPDIYTSHEAFLLEFENALIRSSNQDKINYASSAHLLWLGHRTNNTSKAHLEFVSKICNPIAIKIGEDIKQPALSHIFSIVNAIHTDRLIILIARINNKTILDGTLKKLMEFTKIKYPNIFWICDPMHGNTKVVGNQKIRYLDDIKINVELFNSIHKLVYGKLRGIHLEFTIQDVYECLSFGDDLSSLKSNSITDPRLNIAQVKDILEHIKTFQTNL